MATDDTSKQPDLELIASEALAAPNPQAALALLLERFVGELSATAAAVVRIDTSAGSTETLVRYDPLQRIDSDCSAVLVRHAAPGSTVWLSSGEATWAGGELDGYLIWPLDPQGPHGQALMLLSPQRPAITVRAETLHRWIAAVASRLFPDEIALPEAAPIISRETAHRLNNMLGAIAMHANLGGILMEQAGEQRACRLFDEIAEQGQLCAQEISKLAHDQ